MYIDNLQKYSRYPKWKQKQKGKGLLQTKNNRFLVEKKCFFLKNTYYSENYINYLDNRKNKMP